MSTKRPHPALIISRLEELNRGLVEAMESGVESLEAGVWAPRVDVIETENAILLWAELPGVSRERLSIEVEGDMITISGEKRIDAPGDPDARFACMERARGRFVRRIRLQQLVDTHAGSARLRHGVLEVSFPRIREQRKRPVRLEVESGD